MFVIAITQHGIFLAQSGALSFERVVFGFIASALPAAALFVLVLQLPVWTLLHLVRVPDWLGSTIAGSLAVALYANVIWALSNHPWREPPLTPGLHLYAGIGAIVGAIAGYVCWRVAKEELA
jgi:hypothetical protein